MNKICLQMPLKAEMLLPVRLFVGGIASVVGFSLDDMEDLKVATQEACLILFNIGYMNVTMNFEIENMLKISLCGNGGNLNEKADTKGLQIVSALVDSLSYDEKLSTIEMIKKMV